MTNNSHPAPDSHGSARNNKSDRQGSKEDVGGGGGGSSGGGGASSDDKEEKASHSKEKSVLQAKLTKLAIQIGYAGITLLHNYFMLTFLSLCYIYQIFFYRFNYCYFDGDYLDRQLLHNDFRCGQEAME